MLTFVFVAFATLPLAVCKSILQHNVPRHRNSQGPQGVISLRVETIREMDHEGTPFTQGLEISQDGHHLIETSGSFPPGTASYVRKVDPATGKTIQKQFDGLDKKFAEGIVQLSDGTWFMSTYTDRVLAEYNSALQFVRHHSFPYTGWGLTRSADGSSFLSTDGSNKLRELKLSQPFSAISEKTLTCRGKEVSGLNELEMVDNFLGHGARLLGNVYLTRVVLAIDPATGQCTHVADLGGLGEALSSDEASGFHACNGLAYNRSTSTFFATGKNWKKMFEVRFVEDPSDQDGAVAKLDQFLHIPPFSMMQLGQIPGSIIKQSSNNFTTVGAAKGGMFANVARPLARKLQV